MPHIAKDTDVWLPLGRKRKASLVQKTGMRFASCALLGLLLQSAIHFGSQPASCSFLGCAAHASRFNSARRLFRRANRYAKGKSYRRAITLYKRIVRVLNKRTQRDARGRWEAIFRIAVLRERTQEWRLARQLYESLWRIAPAPQTRYQQRLAKRFEALARQLSPELLLMIRPNDHEIVLRHQRQKQTPRRSQPLGDAHQYWFDVPIGAIQLTVRRLGYQTYRRTTSTAKARSYTLSISLQKLPGIAYPAAFVGAAMQHQERSQYGQAMTRLLEANRQLSPTMRQTPEGRDLAWKIDTYQAQWLVPLNQHQRARQKFARLWRANQGQRASLQRMMCRLAQKHTWRPPSLPVQLRCQPGQHPQVNRQIPPSSSRGNMPSIFTWVLWGGAVASLGIAAGVFFGLAEPTRARRDKTDPPLPNDERQKLHSTYNTQYTLTWVFVGFGIAAAAGGTLYYFLRDRGQSGRKVASRPPTPPTSAHIWQRWE